MWAGKRGFLKTSRRLIGLEYVPLKDERICGEKAGVDIVLAEALRWVRGASDRGRLHGDFAQPPFEALFIRRLAAYSSPDTGIV